MKPVGAVAPAARPWIDIQAPSRSPRRYKAVRLALGLLARFYSSVRVEGLERLPAGPAVLCFTHQSWADPFYMLAAFPERPRMYFFGPEQEEMRRGFRNRLMRWGGVVVPYRPGKRGLLAATARAGSLLAQGAVVAIAGEGQIHAGETVVTPLQDGPAYLSLRAHVPLVPVAINGTGWLGFRRVVRVRFGLPFGAMPGMAARPNAEAVARLTAQMQSTLETLVADFPDQDRPGPVSRWLTELFNDWPDGSRPPAQVRRIDGQVARTISER
jgi:1-acyl-sn-glycerol-3-phosphate acyltransferase